MFRSLTTSRLPKPFALIVAALLALYFVPFNALPAHAVGGFEDHDGNLVSNGGLDWASVATLPGFSHQDDTTCTGTTSDTIFGTGSQKNDDTAYNLGCGSVPPNKNDLRRAYAYTTTTSGNVYLYLAYALESKTGSAHVDFEINKSTNLMANGIFRARTQGDLLISYDWNGSSAIDITIRTWGGSSWGNAKTLDQTQAQAAVNSAGSVVDPIANETYAAETFGEVGINLTAAGIFQSGVCQNFGSALPKTRSSGESFNSELKDYIKPFDVTITNCGTAKIVKTDAAGAPLAGATFKLFADGGDASTYDAAVDTVLKGQCTTVADGTCTIPNLFAGTYWAVEVTPPTGYVADSAAKKVVISAGGEVVSVTFTNSLGKAEWEKRDATSGELVCCATFRVQGISGAAATKGYDVTVKDDEDANTVVESGTTVDDLNDAAGKIRLTNLYTGTYRVTEVSAPNGYVLPSPAAKTFTIDSTTLNTVLTGTSANSGTAGAFLDPRLTPDVSVVKRDTTANGATLAGATFELFTDNGTKGVLDGADVSVAGHGTNPQTTGANGLATWTGLAWGDYLVVEQAAPTGYQLPNPKPVQAFSVTRANSGDNSRVFTFTDPRKPSTITMTKKDKQGNVITTAPARFGLYVDSNNDGVHQAGEPQATGMPELNPQWTTTDGTQGATVDGTASWSNLGFGHYVVHEIQAPQGYALPGNPDVKVDVDAANAGGTFAVAMEDPKLKTPLTVKKTDTGGTPLAGATFQLWQESNGAAGLQTTGSKDTLLGDCVTLLPDGTCTLPEGSAAFEITWPHTYYWAETAPPAGYSLPAPADRVKTVVVTQANITDPFPPTVFTDPKPDIATHATATDLPEGTITDYADLTDVPSDATGTLRFALYGPFDSGTLKGDSCVDAAKLVSSQNISVAGPGRYPTGTGVVSATATKPGTYYWYVTFTSAGDLFGSAVEPCGSPNEVVTVNKAAPVITTQATRTATYLGAQDGTIQDAVKVRPVSQDATGALTVSVWSTPGCTGDALKSWTATRTGSPAELTYTVTLVSAKYQIDWTSPAWAAPSAGDYYWKASYEGDSNNAGADHPCGEVSETRYERSHVDKAPVAVTTSATPSSLITPDGTDPVDDQIFVRYSGVRPTGTVSVTLYGPLAGGAQSCATSPSAHAAWLLDLDNGSVVSDHSGTYVALTTPDFTPTSAGTYRWAASYSGDKNYLARSATCPDPLEVTVVSKPTLDKFADPATVATAADGTPTLVPRDSVITYTLTVTNTGDASISNKPLVDTLPDQVAFQGVTGGTPLPTQGLDTSGHATLTWQVSLAPGASRTFTYTVTVKTAAASGELLVNTARFLGLRDTTTHRVGVPVPTLDKSSPTAGQVVAPGDTIHYTIVVGNTGNFPITASPLVDTLPPGVTFTAATDTYRTTGGGSISSPPVTGTAGGHGTLTWTVTLPAGSTATVEFDALVGNVPQSTTLTNTAGFEQLIDTVVHRTGGPMPSLDKSSPNEGATVPLGSTIHYQLKVANTGDFPITASPVVDTLPTGVTYVAGSATSATTGGGSASDAPTTGSAGGHATLTWTVTLPPSATATFELDVTVNADNPRGAELRNTAAFENLTDFTVHYVGIPGPTLDKFSNPATSDASPAIVQPGTRIHYSVKVGNTGNFPITNAPVVDTLPSNVTVDTGTISSGGVLSTNGTRITWAVTLAPGASTTLTYSVTVSSAAPQGTLLVNTATFQNLSDSTTHVVPTGALTLVKTVSPRAGNGVVVEFGDKLTYTLTASATGNLDQTNVVVTDYLPGRDPARPASGDTTYVAGTATCIGAGTCTVTGPDANGLITWRLGALAAGGSRQITFQVTIDDVTGRAGEAVAVDVLNAGAVTSDRTPSTPSNVVRTPVSKVLPVKIPRELPHTGASLPLGPTVGGALLLLGLGLLLVAAGGRRRWTSGR